MSVAIFLVVFAIAVCASLFWLRSVVRARARQLRPRTTVSRHVAVAPEAGTGKGHLDALDTVPEDVPLAELLAGRAERVIAPAGLERRAARLQERYRVKRQPEPMRALARLLIDTVDAGLPDPPAFHNALRLFFATAPEAILHETAPELERRVDGLRPWLALDMAIPALRTVEARVPGTMDRLIAAAEARGAVEAQIEADRLLNAIAACAAEGRPAPGDALRLAKLLGHRPALMPRAKAEMASHPGDPVWIACWLTVEARAMANGQAVNLPAFRSRVMGSLGADDAALVGTAAGAAEALIEADALSDLDPLWRAVDAALARLSPPPAALLRLADRLGLARPAAGG